jgi:pyruvate dehydrogenase E1 component alpha subunit
MSIAVTNRAIRRPKISFKVADKVHQVLTPEGKVVGALPHLSAEQLVGLYRWMLLGRAYSDRMVALQRQGKMGTFAPLKGQEAASVGLAAPLDPEDWLIASYRENLSYLVKGVPILAMMKQWGGYITGDYPRQTKCPAFQIVLATQTLHAVGVAMAIKYNNEPHIVMTACGDGATSEGDFHEALNFAGVFRAPVVFVVQNNGWAISTPRSRQTGAEYIADRGLGFGIPSRVVDGNDLLAVYQVVSEAIAQARSGDGPTLIEAITYRMDAHTTADDPTRYRSKTECEKWARRDPITRFRRFLVDHTMLTEAEDKTLHEAVNAEIEEAVKTYEALPPPDPRQLFNYVYAELPAQLQRQQADFLQGLELGSERRNGYHAY